MNLNRNARAIAIATGFAAILLSPIAGRAQNLATLVGRVSSDGRPVSGPTVAMTQMCRGRSCGTSYTARTDSTGAYRMAVPGNANYEVMAFTGISRRRDGSAITYESWVRGQSRNVQAGTWTLNFQLRPMQMTQNNTARVVYERNQQLGRVIAADRIPPGVVGIQAPVPGRIPANVVGIQAPRAAPAAPRQVVPFGLPQDKIVNGVYYEMFGNGWSRRGVFTRNQDGSLLYTGGGVRFLSNFTRYLFKDNHWYVAVGDKWIPWTLGGPLVVSSLGVVQAPAAARPGCRNQQPAGSEPTTRELEELQKTCMMETVITGNLLNLIH